MSYPAMDAYCGSTFWNRSLTWDTEYPDLTRCFEKTVLVWIPCLFLWAFCGMDVYYMKTSKMKDVPFSWLFITKSVITALLAVLMVSDLGITYKLSHDGSIEVFSVDIHSPFIKLVTFALSAILLAFNKKRGMRTSGLQSIFWFLLAVCGAFQFRTEILEAQRNEIQMEWYYFHLSYLIYYPLVVCMLTLNCFADRAPRQSKYKQTPNPCPEKQSSFFSRIMFTWFDILVWRGFRKPLQMSDLWDLNPEDAADEVVPIFEKHWDSSVQKFESKHQVSQQNLQFKSNPGTLPISQKKIASVLPALTKSFGGYFLFGSLIKVVADVLLFVNPQILGLLITYVRKSESLWKGYLYAVLIFVISTIQTLLQSQFYNIMFIVGMRTRTALISTVYRKALKVSNNARKESTVGEIVNLMAVDAQKFMELMAYFNMIWSAPLQIFLCIYFLWFEMGPSVLAGLAVMITLIPINWYFATKVKDLQRKQLRIKDERVKLMNEVLNGIKVLKLYAWEPSFEDQIQKIRAREIKTLKYAAYVDCGTIFVLSCAPFLISLATFGTYVLVDEKNFLDANKAYVALSLFNLLKFPMTLMPIMITNLAQTYVSIKRINNFMNAEELDPNNVEHNPAEEDPMLIENGTFSWGENVILKNINILLKEKTLTAVVGTVGAGKSSLVSAFLGEMDKLSGRVNTVGSVAYVAQQAWLQNATLRENILFGKPYDRIFYNRVIEACALRADIDMLPAGDKTEIGEKGINMSGGQRQRVSLARAVYANCDLYLFDDPLSAVDSHVGKHIFEQVIGPKGMLKEKTKLLVTHGITFLPQCDQIVVLKKGEVSDTGNYKELLDKKGAFAEFLVQHINEKVETDEDLDELQDQLEGTPIVEEVTKRRLSRQRSRVSESYSETGSTLQINGYHRQKSVASESSTGSNKNEKFKMVPRRGEKLIEAEKAETGSVSWRVYKYYLQSVGVIFAFVTILFEVLFQCFSIGSNVWVGIWAEDTTLVQNNTVNTAKRDMYLGIYGTLGFGQVFCLFFSTIFFKKACLDGAAKIHKFLLNCVMKLPLSFFDVTPIGRILARFSNDINGVDFRLPMFFHILLTSSVTVAGTLAVISYTNVLFIIVIIPIGVLYYGIQKFYVASSRQLKRLESMARAPIYSHFSETLTGVQAIRAYSQQERFIQENENKVDINQKCYYPSIIATRWLAVRLELVGNLIIFFAALFAVIGKNQAPALVGLSITYALQITQMLNMLVRMSSEVETNIVAVERIQEYGDIPKEAAWEIPHKNPGSHWPEDGTVEFQDYSVRYREGLDLVLKGVDFKIKGGQKIGIVGRTGAGKSSLTLSLFRIIEAAKGQILIDGVNIAQIGLHSLRSHLTIIPQDAVVFSGTLRTNLDPFEKYSDAEIWNSLDNAHLLELVKGFPAGLQHEITEGGGNLSVGQRQLVCLARALLRKTKILILDEATAAVDLETDDIIQKTIRTAFHDCTVLTIAHRLNTIMDSDKVMVLDKGKIAEFDSPEMLLANSASIFHSMCKDAGLV